MKDKIKNLLSLIKSSRKMQIGLCVFVVAVVLIGYFLFFRPPTKQESTEEAQIVFQTDEEEYAHGLEEKLTTLLTSIKDVGSVKVMISLISGFEYVYATETTVKETSSGQVTTTEVVLVDGKPVIEKVIFPSIKGVLISCSGAKDIAVKLKVTEAVQTVVEVKNEDITILTGN